jgi:hypothetical protein
MPVVGWVSLRAQLLRHKSLYALCDELLLGTLLSDGAVDCCIGLR